MRRAILCALSLASAPVLAHPVTFPGNLMFMGEVDSRFKDFNAWYTFAPKHSAGPGYMEFKSEDGTRTREVPNVHYNHRAYRWNGPDAQFNVYLQAGVGAARGNDFSGTRTVLMPGLQVDYETRRVFTAYKWHAIAGGPVKHQLHNAQAGVSFFAGDYDDWVPWAILDVRKMTNLGMDPEVAPTLRLIHKTLYLEAGAVDGKRLRLNVMFNYTF